MNQEQKGITPTDQKDLELNVDTQNTKRVSVPLSAVYSLRPSRSMRPKSARPKTARWVKQNTEEN